MYYLLIWLGIASFMIVITNYYEFTLRQGKIYQRVDMEGYFIDVLNRVKKISGVKVSRLYVCKNNAMNAWMTGLFKPKVILTSVLLKNLSEFELIAILLHETGHYKKQHTLQTLLIQLSALGLFTIAFYIIGLSYIWTIIFLFIVQYIGARVFLPVESHEFSADKFVAEKGYAKYMHDALLKIGSSSDLTIRRLAKLRAYELKNS